MLNSGPQMTNYPECLMYVPRSIQEATHKGSNMKEVKVIRNKFAGKCSRCGKKVPAGFGIAYLEGQGWQVSHLECSPALAAPFVKEETDKAKAKLKAIEDKKARIDFLTKKLKVSKTSLNQVSKQWAWSDEHDWQLAYAGEGTLEEFKELLESRAATGVGLRTSQGVRVTGLDTERRLVSLHESIMLAD